MLANGGLISHYNCNALVRKCLPAILVKVTRGSQTCHGIPPGSNDNDNEDNNDNDDNNNNNNDNDNDN